MTRKALVLTATTLLLAGCGSGQASTTTGQEAIEQGIENGDFSQEDLEDFVGSSAGSSSEESAIEETEAKAEDSSAAESNVEVPDAAELLTLISDEVPKWDAPEACDMEQTIDMAGYGKAGCGLADSELQVGVDTNTLTVLVYSDTAHLEELAMYYDESDPMYVGQTGNWVITAPTQELADEMGSLLEERTQ